jgi:hypothetical protein
MDLAPLHGLEGVQTVDRLYDFEAFALQDALDQPTHLWIVVRQQNPERLRARSRTSTGPSQVSCTRLSSRSAWTVLALR